jgi:hypothetical protein
MACCLADLIEIVMLAARTYALLRAGRTRIISLFIPEENVLELVHSRVNEQ